MSSIIWCARVKYEVAESRNDIADTMDRVRNYVPPSVTLNATDLRLLSTEFVQLRACIQNGSEGALEQALNYTNYIARRIQPDMENARSQPGPPMTSPRGYIYVSPVGRNEQVLLKVDDITSVEVVPGSGV
jgi:hypothetical protein